MRLLSSQSPDKRSHGRIVPNCSGFRKRNHVCGRTIWIADAHRDEGQRFIVHADDELTAFLELERAVCLHLLGVKQ